MCVISNPLLDSLKGWLLCGHLHGWSLEHSRLPQQNTVPIQHRHCVLSCILSCILSCSSPSPHSALLSLTVAHSRFPMVGGLM